GLAGPIEAPEQRDPRAELDLLGAEVAEAEDANPRHQHGSLLDVQPDRHNEVAEVLAVDRLEQARAKRRAELHHQLLTVDTLDALDHELRGEGDLERLAGVRRRDRLPCVAHLRGLRGNGELALGEGEAQGSVALRELADPSRDLEQLGDRKSTRLNSSP